MATELDPATFADWPNSATTSKPRPLVAMLWGIALRFHDEALCDMNAGTLTRKGRDLLDRARKAGVLP